MCGSEAGNSSFGSDQEEGGLELNFDRVLTLQPTPSFVSSHCLFSAGMWASHLIPLNLTQTLHL